MKIFAAAVLVTSIVAAGSFAAGEPTGPNTIAVSLPGDLPLDQPAIGDGVIRSRPVRVDFAALAAARPGDSIAIDLFGDVSLVALVTGRQQRSAERYTLNGGIAGHVGGRFILAVNGEAMAGYVTVPGLGAYRVRFRGDGMHTAQELDPGVEFVCNVEIANGLDVAPAHGAAAPVGACDDGSVIDVIVVYTELARNQAGGVAAVEASIDLMIAYNNVAYVDSEIDTTWNLVFTWQLGPGEDPSLSQLTNPNDGVVDSVHDLRDAYGADQVALVTDGGGGVANGLFNLDPASAARAFCSNGLNSAPSVMSHEIGHNLGCCHAIGDGGGCVGKGLLFEFSNGYRFFGDSGTQWHTVMAYSPGTLIQRFSNPGLLFDGQATGIPEGEPQAADNVLTINLAAFAVSNWRCNDGICEALDLASDGPDCNGNGIPDECDIALGTSQDFNGNGIPDECKPPPSNDACSAAMAVSEGSFPFTTIGATTDGLPQFCDGGDGGVTFEDDTWFLYTPTCTAEVTFSACNAADFDTRIAVYFEAACPPNGPLACSDDAAECGVTSEVTLLVTPLVNYLVRVGATSGGGTGTLTISCPAVEPCPWDCAAPNDGVIGINDFLQLLAEWGSAGDCDFDGGGVGINDFLELLAHWGRCP